MDGLCLTACVGEKDEGGSNWVPRLKVFWLFENFPGISTIFFQFEEIDFLGPVSLPVGGYVAPRCGLFWDPFFHCALT